jgi:hypothetical protein
MGREIITIIFEQVLFFLGGEMIFKVTVAAMAFCLYVFTQYIR